MFVFLSDCWGRHLPNASVPAPNDRKSMYKNDIEISSSSSSGIEERRRGRRGGKRDSTESTRVRVVFDCIARARVVMVKLTLLARVNDGLPLAESLDVASASESSASSNMDALKRQAKGLFLRLGASGAETPPSRMTIESGEYLMHYTIDGNVCYLTVCDRSYQKKLAYQYLEELQQELYALGASVYQQAGAANAASQGPDNNSDSNDGDDVIDAEFTETK